MDASAHTGTVTKGVTAPVALLLPYSMIYGMFPTSLTQRMLGPRRAFLLIFLPS